MELIPPAQQNQDDGSAAAAPEKSALKNALLGFLAEPQKFKSKTNQAFPNLEIVGCTPTAAAFALGQALPESAARPVLIAVAGAKESRHFFEDLSFYMPADASVRLLYFPDLDVAPYVPSSPNPTLTAQRLETLYYLSTLAKRPMEKTVVVADTRALLDLVIDPETLLRGTLDLNIGEEFARELLVEHLLEVGYVKSSLVEDRGNFAVRGGIVDLFPPLLPNPVRLEFIGDELESVRYFNVDSQKTLPLKDGETSPKNILILPVHEVYQDEVSVRRVQNEMKKRMDEQGVQKAEREHLVNLVRNRVYFPGVEHYLPLYRKGLISPYSYFPKESAVQILLNPRSLIERRKKSVEEIFRCFKEAHAENHPTSVINPEERYAVGATPTAKASEEISWLSPSQALATIRFEDLDVEKPDHHPVRVVAKRHESLRAKMEKARQGVGEPFRPLLDEIREYRQYGYHVVLVCGRKTQARRLFEIMTQYEVPVTLLNDKVEFFNNFSSTRTKTLQAPTADQVMICPGEISSGFVLPGEALAVIAEEEIFGPRSIRRRMATSSPGKNAATALISAFSELSPGDYIVHLDFGIGRYLGLERLHLGGIDNDYLHLEYKEGDKLYLPVHRLSRIQKYVGGEVVDLSLDRLGNTSSWERTKERVARKIKEIATELLHLYATRQMAKGVAMGRPDSLFKEFATAFAFEETPDQASAIEEVINDMCQTRPMDRLVCGDVGYGKTEVAIRGIFLASTSGYQSAILAPTTVLVHQHYQNLCKRFEGYPIKVGMLSRFASAQVVKETLAGIKDGSVDVVVGTHRLLSGDVFFKKLGLLVIDEEQRFGVRHKERLKLLRQNVDVLTLSATPIPRTLNMAMTGIRDLSVINTPPVDRVSIRTSIAEFDDRVIREGILREIQRGGQVYFVHNRVHNIAQMAQYLRELVPEARVAVAHGQMAEGELEHIMVEFVDQKYDVLLCTSIIESGLDIPLVNTIMINRADQFGLSQLYQIRGRVGRSSRRAYAYLLVPGQYLISEGAQKRLDVLQKHTELGSGFRIASYDLEIRGAGNLLGRDQAGHVSAVGLDMYASLMNTAMRELKGERVEAEIDPEIDLHIPAFIPETYIADTNLRLGMYKRLSMLESDDEVEDLETELNDRFGTPSREVKNLLKVIEIKILARRACVAKLIFGGVNVVVHFDTRTPVEVEYLLHLVNTHRGWRLTPDNRLIVPFQSQIGNDNGTIPIDREVRVLAEIRKLLEKLLRVT